MTQHIILPPDHDRDFHQLTGAFDRPVAPSPAFTERLKQRIAETQQEKGASTMHAVQAAQPRATRMTAGRVIPLPDQGRRLVRILEATAAAVLILALIGGGFFLNRDSNGPGDDPIRLAAVTSTTTPEADVTPAPTASAWTDPGHTNAYPAGFDPETAQSAEALGEFGLADYFGQIIGDTLVLIGTPSDVDPENFSGKPTITGVDLVTGSKKWSMTRDLSPFLAAGTNAIFSVGLGDGTSEGEQTLELFALSPESGEALWSQTVFSLPISTGLDIVSPFARPVSTPIIIDGTIYIAKDSGDVTAFDAHTGDILWQTEGWDDERNPANVGGSLVGDADYLYVVNGDNSILKLDRANGDVLDTLAQDYRPAPNFLLELHLDGNRLVMIARDSQQSFSPALLDVLSTDTGSPLWSTELQSDIEYGYPAGGLAIANGILALPERGSEDTTPTTGGTLTDTQVRFFDIETGEILGNVTAPDWHGASASASGSVLCVHGSSPQITCFDTAYPESSPKTIDLKASYVSEAPPSPILFWNDSAIVLGHDGGPYIIRSGNAAPEATPVAQETQSPARGDVFGTTADLNATWPDSALPTEPLAPSWGRVIAAPKWAMPYGDVVAALGTTELVVLDAATGSEIWSKPVGDAFADRLNPATETSNLIRAFTNNKIALPWIAGDTIYVATPSELAGFDLMTGEEVFRAEHLIRSDEEVQAPGLSLPLSLAIDRDTAYVLSPPVHNESSISAIDLKTGDMLWTTPSLLIAPAQMAVSDDHLIIAIKSDKDYLTALNTADGSAAWTIEDAIASESRQSFDAVSFFIVDSTVIETRTDSGAVQTEATNHALRIAVYDLESGDALWTSRSDDPAWAIDPDAVNNCGFYPRTANDQIVIPCGVDGAETGTLVAFDIRGDGTPTHLTEQDVPYPSTTSLLAGESAWVYGADDAILLLDLSTSDTIDLGTMGGNECITRSLPTGNGFVCLTTDNLGTYTIQAFTPPTEASPAASPASSAVFTDPGHTGRLSADTPVIDDSIRMTINETDAANDPITNAVISGDLLITYDPSIMPALRTRDLTTGNLAWSKDMQLLAPPVVDDQRVYVLTLADVAGDDAKLIAFDLTTGLTSWLGPEIPNFDIRFLGASGPILAGDLALISDFEGNTFAVDRSTGTLRWRAPDVPIDIDYGAARHDWSPQSSLAATDDRAFVKTADNRIIALDLATGEQAVSIDLSDLIGVTPSFPALQVSGDRLTIITAQQVYEHIGEFTLSILDAADLSLIAQHDLERGGNMLFAPALTSEAIYVPTNGEKSFTTQIRAFSLVDGSEQPPCSRSKGPGTSPSASPAQRSSPPRPTPAIRSSPSTPAPETSTDGSSTPICAPTSATRRSARSSSGTVSPSLPVARKSSSPCPSTRPLHCRMQRP